MSGGFSLAVLKPFLMTYREIQGHAPRMAGKGKKSHAPHLEEAWNTAVFV